MSTPRMTSRLRDFRFSFMSILLGLLLAVGATQAQAQACPNYQLNGAQHTVDANGLWSPRSYAVTAGGNINLGNCASVPGHGYVVQAPDFTFTYNAQNMGRDLEFRVQGTCDTVLLVNGANAQWHFNDDADGTVNPRLRLSNAPSGVYDVWVGTFSQGTCSATLVLETFGGGQVAPPPPPVAQTCPDYRLNGQQYTVDANGLWSPRSFAVTAGGTVNLSNCGSVPGHGRVAVAPDFTFTYNALSMGRDLEFRVQGTCDTVLLVNGADAQWHYNDDSDGSRDPRIRLSNAPSGVYDVWVGTFGASTCSATLIAETFGGGQVVQPPVAQPPVVRPPVVQPPVQGSYPAPFLRDVLPNPGNLTGYRGRNGQVLHFAVTGAAGGSVWGTGIYTDDSQVAAAAVHAGVLAVGETRVVSVVIRPGQSGYQGGTRNGVNSMNFGNWSGSYSFVAP